jgi:hypothetical protein
LKFQAAFYPNRHQLPAMMHSGILLLADIFQEYISVAGLHTNSQSKGAPLVALPSHFKAGLTKQCFVYEEERHAGNAAAVH